MMLCYLLSFVLATLGLDPLTSTSIGQIMFVADIFLLGTGLQVCKCKDDSREDIENVDTDATNPDPPSYKDVLDQEEKNCPSYSQAVVMEV